MTEMVIALLMIVNGEIKEHRIQESMSNCLKGKRIAMRESKKHIEYQCIKSMAETEIYLMVFYSFLFPHVIISRFIVPFFTMVSSYICIPHS